MCAHAIWLCDLQYLEKLYDESMEEKVGGTGLILQLSKTVGNLEALITNGSVPAILYQQALLQAKLNK